MYFFDNKWNVYLYVHLSYNFFIFVLFIGNNVFIFNSSPIDNLAATKTLSFNVLINCIERPPLSIDMKSGSFIIVSILLTALLYSSMLENSNLCLSICENLSL